MERLVFGVDSELHLGLLGPKYTKLGTKGEANVIFKRLIAATAAAALAATPAIAASSSAAALSVAPAAETAEGSRLDGGGNIVVIVLALVAAGLGLWVIIDGDDDNAPVSP